MKAAMILLGHGARDPHWARPMQRAREIVLELAPHMGVELAYLEFMSPVLGEAIERLIVDGACRITVVPMFLAQGGHVKKDVPELVAAARARHPTCTIELAQAVGEAEAVIAAMAAHALASTGFDDAAQNGAE